MKTNTDSLQYIAYENGLTYIETSSQPNGYPTNIKGAIIGLSSFKEAQKLADENNLSIELFTKKDGQDLWYRTGNLAHEPMKNSSEDFGDNYSKLEKMSESEFLENEVSERLKDLIDAGENFESLKEYIKEQEKLFNEIESMEDDEIVITCQGEYYETIKKESMYFSHDTRHITIGLINK